MEQHNILWPNQPYAQDHFLRYANGTDTLKVDFFNNAVYYDSKNQSLRIRVDVSHDIELESLMELEDAREFPDADIPTQQQLSIALGDTLGQRFSFDFAHRFSFVQNLRSHHLLAGADVSFGLGEGLLDFVYGSFDENVYPPQQQIHQITYPEDTSEADIVEFQERLQFDDTMATVQDTVYHCLYTAIFPPLFRTVHEKAVHDYFRHLMVLQNEFLSLLDFCYDTNFFPEVLGDMTPMERFACYQYLSQRNEIWSHQETMHVSLGHYYEKPITDGHRQLSELFDSHPESAIIWSSHKYKTEFFYTCDNLLSLLRLEFSKMLASDMRLCKCQYCGKYFITKGNYKGVNCDRIQSNGKTCQQLAALKKYKEKTGDTPALKLYNRYYKRYFARTTAGTIKEDVFKKWQYQATVMRDDCTNGMVLLEDFALWLDESFPNKPRKTADK